MSGGHFNYVNDSACREVFGWDLECDYGETGFGRSKAARRIDPLEDVVISELVFDVFCLLHSYDWYASSDTSEETYRDDVKRFKEKWLKPISAEYVKEVVGGEVEAVRQKLYRVFGIET